MVICIVGFIFAYKIAEMQAAANVYKYVKLDTGNEMKAERKTPKTDTVSGIPKDVLAYCKKHHIDTDKISKID